MHRDVGAFLGERDFELLHEQSLAAHLRERPVEDAVAARRHADDRDLELGVAGTDRRGDHLGLPHGEPAFAGRDAKRRGRCAHISERLHQAVK